MKTGEMVKRSDLPASTIRYYEHIGLIGKPAREQGQRVYDESTADLLEAIKVTRGPGYSLEQIRPLLNAFLTCNEPSSICQELVHSKLVELDEFIEKTQEMKRILMECPDCDCDDAKDCFLHTC
jgi:DNA-binding transcriptional MerR regulator